MKHFKVILTSAALILGAAAANTWSLLGGKEASKPRTHATETAAEPSSSPGVGPAPRASLQLKRDAWKVGERRVYDVEYGGALSGPMFSEGGLLLTGRGELELVAETVTPERVLLQARLLRPSVTMTHAAGTEEHIEGRFQAEFEHPMLVAVRPSGAIEYVSAPPELGAFAHNQLTTLLSALEFVRPEAVAPSYDQWTTQESDHNGIYDARYVVMGPNTVAKAKLKYGFLRMAEALGSETSALEQRLSASSEYQLASGQVVTGVHTDEKLELGSGGKGLRSEHYVTMKLVGTSVAEVRPSRAGLAREALFMARSSPPVEDPGRHDELLAGASYDELVGDLRSLPLNADSAARQAALVERLSALFATDEAALRRAGASLKRPTTREEREGLLGALARTDTPAATAQLTDVARDANAPVDSRRGAVKYLGFDHTPAATTFDDLREIASTDGDPTVRTAATLALGSAADYGSEGETADAASAAVRNLSRTARSAPTAREREIALAALGNSASVDAIDAVRACLGDPDPHVRAAAVDALRLIEDPRADSLILDTLQRDSEPRVRLAAVKVATARPLTAELAQACFSVLRSDPSTDVRAAIVDFVVRKLPDDSARRSLLTWVIANDASDSVRVAAQNALDPPPSRFGT